MNNVSLHDLAPTSGASREEVLRGLRSPQKELPCKLLYDEYGSQLFEQICALDEYYPTRAELRIMRASAADMAASIGPDCLLIEYGSGSSTKIRYLLDHPDAVRGAVLSSPYLRLKLRVSPIKLIAGKLISRVLPSLPMRNDLKPEQLTRDVEIQNATRRDPLYQQIATPRWFTESSAAQETCLRRATEFVTPFLLLFGGADPIADPPAGREFFEHATSKDKQHKQYDGLLHELFHEPERDVVFRDVIGWLDERARRVQPRAATGEGG